MSKQLAEQATTPASHRWRDLIRRKDDGAGEIHRPAQANLRTIRWFSGLQGFLPSCWRSPLSLSCRWSSRPSVLAA
jgi:hypothetical protein